MTSDATLHAEIPPQLYASDELLTRYGRWAVSRPQRRHCGSLEGLYRSPANDDDRQPRGIALPVLDAMAAQRALARVPDRERIVLAVLYVPQRLPPAAQFHMLRIPAALVRGRHLAGLRMFDNLLQKPLHCAHLTAGAANQQPMG